MRKNTNDIHLKFYSFKNRKLFSLIPFTASYYLLTANRIVAFKWVRGTVNLNSRSVGLVLTPDVTRVRYVIGELRSPRILNKRIFYLIN